MQGGFTRSNIQYGLNVDAGIGKVGLCEMTFQKKKKESVPTKGNNMNTTNTGKLNGFK